MERGEVLSDAVCVECGDVIHKAIVRAGGRVICNRCFNPPAPSCGETATGVAHWDDDPSGASASWDMAVERYESADY